MKNRLVRRTNGVQKSKNDVQKTVLVVVANPFYYVEKLILSTKNYTIKKDPFRALDSWRFPLFSVANKKNSLFLGVSDSFGFKPFFIMSKNSLLGCSFITAPSLLIGC
jgi:hypothetical protein